MSTSNPAPGVGGTAQDGGLSTAATVADGGPDAQSSQDAQFLPAGVKSSEKPYSKSETNAKTSNAAPGVGGTSQDGGLSTAATVADGGPSAQEDDPDYKPS
ncbi:hypothetical protein LTR53_006939 [Teratosphaeriaceae sp. CCFEE 6253]|nr:hypothetical protein LTR53_006939 [Teratosphaeriaceae sp. CCFEE 6253]